MTFDPTTPAGKRGTRRGFWRGIAVIVAINVQGIFLAGAMNHDRPWRWLLWALVMASLVAYFIWDAMQEKRRRRRDEAFFNSRSS